ncbi:MAG: ergothioneine biosynthesis protein EgtC [Cyanobacteria bacterium P01_F01_bin.3]
MSCTSNTHGVLKRHQSPIALVPTTANSTSIQRMNPCVFSVILKEANYPHPLIAINCLTGLQFLLGDDPRMCRILGYLGPSISLDKLVLAPEHSMLVQSYKPKELDSAILNADGFGLGWHGQPKETDAFVYRNVLPMWNDRSLDDLCRYIHTDNFVVNLRSATYKMPVDLSNCQPFKWRYAGKQLLFVHNGFIENFFDSLQRPIREQLCDRVYRSIQGLTDSEHMFALLVHYLESQPGIDIAEALKQTIDTIAALANQAGVHVAANIILSLREPNLDNPSQPRQRLIALRYDNQQTAPSLYLLKNAVSFPNSVILSSEPLFADSWQKYAQSELISIDNDQSVKTYASIA